MKTTMLMRTLCFVGIAMILLYNFLLFDSTIRIIPQLFSIDIPDKLPCVTEHIDFYRYKDNYTFEKNVIDSNNFLYSELTSCIQQRYVDDSKCPMNDGQVIVGRFSGSEPHLMKYSELSNDTTEPIPGTFHLSGFYYFNEQTFEEQRAFAQSIGKLHCDDYTERNLFGLFDWPHRPDQQDLMRKYAPNAGWIHADALYPPCLVVHNEPDSIPWTQSFHDKTVLIVHPFIDTIQAQIPKLQHIWSNVNVTGAPFSCMPATMNNVKFVRAQLPVANPTRSWNDVLDDLKQQINDVGHFDIALLGCGGFGSPLLTHIKQMTHKPSAMYIGGALQLYFGIHGARWYSNEAWYQHWHPLYTDSWTWPYESDLNFSTIGLIEDASYVRPGQGTGQS
jgi:hypothetical protein